MPLPMIGSRAAMARHGIGKGIRMSARWLASVVLSLSGLATAAACPPPLSAAQSRQLVERGAEEMHEYASLRWLKCGWRAAEPAMREWRDAVKADARKDAAETGSEPDGRDEFVEQIVMSLHADPNQLIDADFLVDMTEEPGPDDPPPLADLMRLRISPATLASNFESGIAGAAALLRRGHLSDADELMIDLALVKQMARRGELDAARARLDRIARDVQARQAARPEGDDESDYGELEFLATMQAAFEPVSAKSAAVDDSAWVLDRSSRQRFYCGTGAYMERMFGASTLRESVLKSGDLDAAIGEVLVLPWRDHLIRGAPQATLLLELLRRRYGEAGLRQGWEDAIATLRDDGATPSIQLFGHYLPLPKRVREDDPGSPDSTRERALGREELVALVKDSPLYRLSLGKPASED